MSSPPVVLTNIIGFLGHHSAFQTDHLNGIQTYLKDVINEGQQRSQGKCCHKYGGEAELDYWRNDKEKKKLEPKLPKCLFILSINDTSS